MATILVLLSAATYCLLLPNGVHFPVRVALWLSTALVVLLPTIWFSGTSGLLPVVGGQFLGVIVQLSKWQHDVARDLGFRERVGLRPLHAITDNAVSFNVFAVIRYRIAMAKDGASREELRRTAWFRAG